MLVSKVLRIEPETAPSNATDRRPYLLATRANATLKAATVSVTSTATELATGLARRRKVYVKNLAGNGDIFLGGLGVTTSNGYPLRTKEEIWIDLTPGAMIYAIQSASGSVDVRVLEAGI